MPDAITPVGAMVQAPNPNQSLQSLSSILGVQQQQIGLQQQRQQLETGQFYQQEAQAGAQQAQQAMSERNIMIQSVRSGKDPDGNSIMSDEPDPVTGKITPDPNKLKDMARRWMPQTADDVIQKLTKTQSDKAALSDSLRQLGSNYRTDLANIVKPFIGQTGVQGKDVKNSVDAYVAQNPQAAAAGHWALNLVGDHFDNMSEPAKQDALTHLVAQFNPSITGTTPVQVQAPGNRLAFVESNRFAPGGTGTTLGTAAQGLAPAQQLGYVSQAAGAVARGSGTGNADIDTSNMIAGAQREARGNIDLTKRIDQLAEVVAPGALPQRVSQGLGALGLQDVNQARSELVKDLGRLRGNFSLRAGSDQRAATVLEGLPTDQTPTQTIHQAMDMTRGTERQTLALGQLQAKSAKATGGQMNGFQSEAAHASAVASPLMHEFLSLTPAEQAAFYKRNFATREQAKAFRDQVNSVKKLTPDAFGQ